MYRNNNVDHAPTYTPDDVVLFRESPFAVWMERLTLENPDHGIPADLDSIEPHDAAERRDDIVATLRAEGRNVVLIDWDQEEPERRTATLAAMRAGADFIVNGHLAVGTLSGKTHLLMRTSGYSDLGDFLYVPCETLSLNTFQSAFRLCFTADLLHSLQGQLPPQMLIIRDSAEVVPLQTEDYIYYYRAVLQRFMLAMNSFRKHRMPEPAESAHFGRWSECASEVLKQRALGQQQRAEEQQAEEQQTQESEEEESQEEEVMEMPQLRVASGSGALHSAASGPTLAEQARLLAPDSYRNGTAPGHTPNLARFGRPRAVAALPDTRDREHNRRSSDAALQNLAFIGSNTPETPIDIDPLSGSDAVVRSAPAPNLRETPTSADRMSEPVVTSSSSPGGLPELEPRAPVFLPPDRKPVVEPPHERLQPDPLDSDGVKRGGTSSVIDMDSAPAPSLAPVVQRAEAEFARIGLKDPMFRRVDQAQSKPQPEGSSPTAMPFSNSLITSQEINDC